ncbi:MAG: DNA-protecting protein DprA [Planctomycetia bacterium]|nr:DNA-protecting protein DprA [Planctomycetia bacterium]
MPQAPANPASADTGPDPTDTDLSRLRSQVRLACLPGVGPRQRQLLLERFGSADAVFAASADEIRGVGRFGGRLAALMPSLADHRAADEVMALCRKRSIDIIPEGDDRYPGLLAGIHDPPGLLFVRGRLLPCDGLAVAVVGARHATAYGLKVAEQLGGSLARAGYTVVSGLARGIDAAAHRGAVAAGGRTIAVLGSGVLNVYPPEHVDLAVEIVRDGRGAVVSELPPLAEPLRGTFPQRNRIVSGLSLGTVVVQASDRSGALITARLAGEQGREVFAVPGPVDCRMSRGCHRLIRDGAKLVAGIDDILEEFGPLFETVIAADGRPVASAAELQLGELERRVLDAVEREPTSVDAVVDACGLAASQVLATIGVLEMRRLLRRLPGNRFARA